MSVVDRVAAAPGRRRRRAWTLDRVSFMLVFLGLPLAIYVIFVVSPFLQAIGYSYDPGSKAQSPDRRWLLRHKAGHRTHHLHVVEHGSSAWSQRIDFCERLQRDAVLREQYQALKVRVLARVGGDRESYTAAKEPFIRNSIMAQSTADPRRPAFSRAGDLAGLAGRDRQTGS